MAPVVYIKEKGPGDRRLDGCVVVAKSLGIYSLGGATVLLSINHHPLTSRDTFLEPMSRMVCEEPNALVPGFSNGIKFRGAALVCIRKPSL